LITGIFSLEGEGDEVWRRGAGVGEEEVDASILGGKGTGNRGV
jgi:hypothetical protein